MNVHWCLFQMSCQLLRLDLLLNIYGYLFVLRIRLDQKVEKQEKLT